MKAGGYPLERLLKAREELKRKGLRIYDFGTGDPEEPPPSIVREALKSAVDEVKGYPSVKGRRELRVVVSRWLSRRFSVDVDPEKEIIPTSGSKEAIFHFPLVFVDPRGEKRRVIFGRPGYPVYEKGTLYAGGIPHPVDLKEEDGYLLRLDKIPEEVLRETAIVWINYPHNPTSAVASLSYFREVYSICREFGIILCSDECYTEIYFGESPPSALQVGKEGIVVFHSLSKRSGMTGFRSGFVAGDAKIIGEYLKHRVSFGVASPDFIQRSAEVAWSDEGHVEERRRIFRKKRDLFLSFFERIGLECRIPDATFYLWVRAPSGMKAEDYALYLLEYGIIVSPGKLFGEREDEHFRVSLSPTLEKCEDAIKVWEVAHRRLK